MGRLSWNNAVGTPVEQCGTNLFFQAIELPGNHRCRSVQVIRGFTYRGVFHDLDKVGAASIIHSHEIHLAYKLLVYYGALPFLVWHATKIASTRCTPPDYIGDRLFPEEGCPFIRERGWLHAMDRTA